MDTLNKIIIICFLVALIAAIISIFYTGFDVSPINSTQAHHYKYFRIM